MFWPSGISNISFIRRWNWLGLHLTSDGEAICRLWEKVEAWIRNLPSAESINICCRAVQLGADNPYHSRTLWLCFYGWQWGYLRYLSPKSWHWTAFVYKLEPVDCSSRVLNYRVTKIRRLTQCWLDGVSNQPGSLSEDSFPVGDLRANNFNWESLSRIPNCCWNDKCLFRTC